MSLIGTYKGNQGFLTLDITEADVSTGKLAGTLTVARPGPGGPFEAQVEGHYHLFGNTGRNTSLVVTAWADDIEGQSTYFAWAGFSKGPDFEELAVRGGESVVRSANGGDSQAVESAVTSFIRQQA
ncbi:MAG: hypothetical protein MI919_32515 [Holophagales bacterium]|nr:hypothetical protein [Holophagales bacterium]